MISEFITLSEQRPPVRFLNSFLKKKLIPHALLFTGNEGTGKRITAFSFAAACNCSSSLNADAKSDIKACGICRSCRKIKSGIHPDIIEIKPDGQVIKVENIRSVRQILTRKPYEAEFRYIIISDAHKMNPASSNALLKVLEEPEKNTVFILTAVDSSELLPTIVSRCQNFKFRKIPFDELEEMIIKEYGINQEAGIAAYFSDGSFTRAGIILKADKRAYRRWVLSVISSDSFKDTGIQLCFAEKLSKNKKELEFAMQIIFFYLRDILVYKSGYQNIVNKDIYEIIAEKAKQKSIDSLLSEIKVVQRIQKNIQSGINLRVGLEVLAQEIRIML